MTMTLYSTIGKCIADIYTRGKYTIEVVYLQYTVVTAQQTKHLPENTSQNNAIFAQIRPSNAPMVEHHHCIYYIIIPI